MEPNDDDIYLYFIWHLVICLCQLLKDALSIRDRTPHLWKTFNLRSYSSHTLMNFCFSISWPVEVYIHSWLNILSFVHVGYTYCYVNKLRFSLCTYVKKCTEAFSNAKINLLNGDFGVSKLWIMTSKFELGWRCIHSPVKHLISRFSRKYLNAIIFAKSSISVVCLRFQ